MEGAVLSCERETRVAFSHRTVTQIHSAHTEVLVGIPCLPHRSVRLVASVRPRVEMVQAVRQLPKMSMFLPLAPRAPPTAWDRTIQAIDSQLQDTVVTIVRDGPRKAALQGLSNAYEEWVGTAEQEPRCTGSGRQACPRMTRVVTRGQSRWAGCTCSSMPLWVGGREGAGAH